MSGLARGLLMLLSIGLASLMPRLVTASDLVVVVHAGSGAFQLSREEVVNIFMGRYRTLPSGIAAKPIDQPGNLPGRAQFYLQLVGKDLATINAYWSRLTFTGGATPPRQADSIREVRQWVENNPGAIAYLERGEVGPRTRIVYEFPQ